jgi:Flp pilus assembly protein TadD
MYALNNLGKVHGTEGRYQQALLMFERAAALAPEAGK